MAIRALNENGQPMETPKPGPEPVGARHTITGVLLLVGFVGLIAGVILYFTFGPTICPVRYRIPGDVVTAPTGAQISALAPQGTVRKGETLVEFTVFAESGSDFPERVHRWNDQLRELKAEEKTRNDSLRRMDREVELLKHELAAAESESELAVQTRAHARRVLDLQTDRVKNSQRLFNLDAIRKSEHEYAEELHATAEYELKRAQLQEKRALTRIEALKTRIRSEESVRAAEAAAGALDRTGNDALAKQLAAQLSQVEMIPGGLKFQIRAPYDGFVAGSGLRVGSRVAPGDVVMTVFALDGGRLEVFVPEDLAGQVSGSTAFRVWLGGKPFRADVRLLSMNLEQLPNPLKSRTRNPDGLYRRIELAPPGELPGLLDGQTGTAIIE